MKRASLAASVLLEADHVLDPLFGGQDGGEDVRMRLELTFTFAAENSVKPPHVVVVQAHQRSALVPLGVKLHRYLSHNINFT